MKKQAATIMTAAILSSTFSGIASADTYTVKKGDTLSHIAYTYKSSVIELKKLNHLSSDLIYVNQMLTVPGNNTAVNPTTSNSKEIQPVTPVNSSGPLVYTVVSGDTLSKIAAQHKISLNNLMKWNNLNSHLIFPGQKLTVGTNAATPSPAQPVKAPAQPVNTVPAKTVYTVESGDTLSGISMKYNVTIKQLKDLNNLKSDLIFVGQKLVVGTNSATAPAQPVKTPAQPATPVSAPEQQPVQNEASVVIAAGKEMLGTPYVWGGSTPQGFDCSGFIHYAFNKAGIKMGRYSSEGYYNRSFYINNPQPGDLVFFENTYKKGISHMGIYLGNNEFLHADADGVVITNLNNPYYKKHFEGFKRFY